MIVSQMVMKEKKDVLLSAGLGIAAALIGISLFGASGYVISKAALIPPLYTLTIMLALLKVFGIARALGKYAERYYSHRATFTILGNLRSGFFEKLEPLPPSVLKRWRSGDLLARFVGDVENLQNFFLRVFYPPLIFFFVFTAVIFFTAFYSVWISLTLGIGMLITGLAAPAFFAWRQHKAKQSVQAQRNELSAEAAEFLYGFRDLKIHQKAETKKQDLLKLSGLALEEQERRQSLDNGGQAVNMAVSMLAVWSIAMIGAFEAASGQLDGLFLAMLIMMGLNVFEYAFPMAALPAHFADARRSAIQLQSVAQDNAHSAKEPAEPFAADAVEIIMDDVTFAYPEDFRNTLHHISLELKLGSRTAIVGPSGSGKSTILQILLKMYEPESGSLTCNHRPFQSIDQEDIWRLANPVLQENHFFFGSIRDNLLLANEHATEKMMEQALKEAELSQYSLEDKVLEKGENLSGGERQKLALARAFLREGQLWLLDEAFSSMDLLTEKRLMEKVLEKSDGKTAVFISHRLAGLQSMDQIVVMEAGRIKEKGTYEELMNKKGDFYKLKQVEAAVLSY